ncbi:unnamed protein product, partial [Strongylus vulgaris]
MWWRNVRHLCSEVRSHPELYFSGIQPTGVPHLGNYFGFIEPWIQLQKVRFWIFGCYSSSVGQPLSLESLPSTTKMVLAIADQHAISLGPKAPKELRRNIRLMAMSLLACGVDPSRTLLFRQSSVPQITQLSWILGSLQTIAQLQRLPQFKEKAL